MESVYYMTNWISKREKKRKVKINGIKIIYNYYMIQIQNPYKIKDFDTMMLILNKFLDKTDFVFKGDVKYLAYQWVSYNTLLPEGITLQYTFKNSIPFIKAKLFAFVSFLPRQKRRFVKWKKKKRKQAK